MTKVVFYYIHYYSMGLFWLWKSKETQENIKIITIDDLYPKDTLWKDGWQKYFPTLNYDALRNLSLQAPVNRDAAILYFDTLLKEFGTKDGRYFPTSPEATAYNEMSESTKIKHLVNHITPQIESYLSEDKKTVLNMLKILLTDIETKNTKEVVDTTQNNIASSIH